MHTHRFYRSWVSRGRLCRFRIVRYESDIEIAAEYDLSVKACEALHGLRRDLEDYISVHRYFMDSLTPVRVRPGAPDIVMRMAEASAEWGVGPMAAVAGAVAEGVGRALAPWSGTVLVENGGDVYVRSSEAVEFLIYAGDSSPFTGTVGFSVEAPEGAGVCTSSGTVGHSRSFGRAGAVTVIADDCALADAAATATANRIQGPRDAEVELEKLRGERDLRGAIACCGHVLASGGVRLTWTDKRGEA